MNVRSNYAE